MRNCRATDVYIERDLIFYQDWCGPRRPPRGSGYLAAIFQGFVNNHQERPLQFSFPLPLLTRHLAFIWYIFMTVHFSFTSLFHILHLSSPKTGLCRSVTLELTKVSGLPPYTPVRPRGEGRDGRPRTLPGSLEAFSNPLLWILFIF